MKIETDSDRKKEVIETARSIQEVGQVLKRYSDFIQAKDVDGVTELFSSDCVIFDLMTPFQYTGIEMLRSRLRDWFNGYEGAIQYDFDQLQIHASETVAVAHALILCGGTILKDTKASRMWLRVTMTLKNFDDGWQIVHEHTSEPFDMETGRAVQQRETH